MQGAGSREQGAGSRVQEAGCRVQGAGCRVQGPWSRGQGVRLRVQGSGVSAASPSRGGSLHQEQHLPRLHESAAEVRFVVWKKILFLQYI